MDTELRRSRKTSLVTGNRPWNTLARKARGQQGSGYGSSKDAGRTLRVSVEESHGRLSSTTSLQARHLIHALRVAAVAAATFFFVLLYGLRTAEAVVPVQQHYLPQPPVKTPATEEEIAAARGIESLLVNQMIDQMRKTVPENEFVPKSQAERVFESLLDNEYARVMSETGSFGVADLVLAEIQGKR